MQENRQISYACKMSEEMQVGCLPAASSSGPPCQPSPAAARRAADAARQVVDAIAGPEYEREVETGYLGGKNRWIQE